MTNCSRRYSKCSKQRSPNGFTELITQHIISVLILILNSNSESPWYSSLGCGRSALSSLSCMCLEVHASAWACTRVSMWLHVCAHVPPPVSVHVCECVHAPVCTCACVLCVCVPVSVLGSKIKFSWNRSWGLLQQGLGRRWSMRSQEHRVEGRTPGSWWDWKDVELGSGLHAVSERGSLEAGLPGQEQALQQKSVWSALRKSNVKPRF